MEWFKKHTDTVIILSAILSSVIWMNSQFNEVNSRFSVLEKDIAVMKTVLIIKEIMPKEVASN